jgi:hypothetical protein
MSPAEREALRGFVIDVIRVEVANAIKGIDLEALRGKPGENGKDVDMAAVRDMVGEAVALFEVPKDGEPGKDADPALIEKMVADAVSKIPAPKNGEPGKDADPSIIEEMVAEAVAAMPKPENGKDADPAETMAMITDLFRTIPLPRDGHDGITKDELKIGLEEMLSKSLPDAVRLAVDDAISELPIVTYKGVYMAGESYVPGNTVTFGGSLWHCNVPTRERPDTNGDWTLAVKKGRDFRPPDRKPTERKAG